MSGPDMKAMAKSGRHCERLKPAVIRPVDSKPAATLVTTVHGKEKAALNGKPRTATSSHACHGVRPGVAMRHIDTASSTRLKHQTRCSPKQSARAFCTSEDAQNTPDRVMREKLAQRTPASYCSCSGLPSGDPALPPNTQVPIHSDANILKANHAQNVQNCTAKTGQRQAGSDRAEVKASATGQQSSLPPRAQASPICPLRLRPSTEATCPPQSSSASAAVTSLGR
mmetsp:Transcript_100502/g.181371  ORF Transcript_100502/g.181371 Transcript_100502/m.181371 type:complete len:226 (-) Transcript_100502:698-1375(-)